MKMTLRVMHTPPETTKSALIDTVAWQKCHQIVLRVALPVPSQHKARAELFLTSVYEQRIVWLVCGHVYHCRNVLGHSAVNALNPLKLSNGQKLCRHCAWRHPSAEKCVALLVIDLWPNSICGDRLETLVGRHPAVTYTAAGWASQELCAGLLWTMKGACENYNHVTTIRPFGLGWSKLGPSGLCEHTPKCFPAAHWQHFSFCGGADACKWNAFD